MLIIFSVSIWVFAPGVVYLFSGMEGFDIGTYLAVVEFEYSMNIEALKPCRSGDRARPRLRAPSYASSSLSLNYHDLASSPRHTIGLSSYAFKPAGRRLQDDTRPLQQPRRRRCAEPRHDDIKTHGLAVLQQRGSGTHLLSADAVLGPCRMQRKSQNTPDREPDRRKPSDVARGSSTPRRQRRTTDLRDHTRRTPSGRLAFAFARTVRQRVPRTLQHRASRSLAHLPHCKQGPPHACIDGACKTR